MTRTLTLKNRFQGNTTIVENDFIDNYLAKANGEYSLLMIYYVPDEATDTLIYENDGCETLWI